MVAFLSKASSLAFAIAVLASSKTVSPLSVLKVYGFPLFGSLDYNVVH
jgi:hypothetical protein